MAPSGLEVILGRKLVFGFLVAALVVLGGGSSAPSSQAADPGQQGGAPTLGQLDALQARMLALFDNPSVVFTDVDEGARRLTVAVQNAGAERGVRQQLTALGVPVNLVDIVVTPPVVEVATLRDQVRPVAGGLQIAFAKRALVYMCTLGFVAVRSGVNGFVTNSHCTEKELESNGTKHYQPLLPTQIGTEAVDPSGFSCGNNKCRYSDSAFSSLLNGVSADLLGFIYKTTGVDNGSLTIATDGSALARFRITGEAPPNKALTDGGPNVLGAASGGETLNKVGRTTGWSQGLVTNTCIDVKPIGSKFVRVCQDRVEASVDGGDSGSPVFRIASGDDVTLYGILWGGSINGSSFIYSPIANVQHTGELGSLTNCASGFTC